MTVDRKQRRRRSSGPTWNCSSIGEDPNSAPPVKPGKPADAAETASELFCAIGVELSHWGGLWVRTARLLSCGHLLGWGYQAWGERRCADTERVEDGCVITRDQAIWVHIGVPTCPGMCYSVALPTRARNSPSGS